MKHNRPIICLDSFVISVIITSKFKYKLGLSSVGILPGKEEVRPRFQDEGAQIGVSLQTKKGLKNAFVVKAMGSK